jgi:hypothetical protein
VQALNGCFMDEDTTLQTTALKAKHRTTPLAESITPVPGYPRKLTIYKLEASSYWWVRYYTEGKVVRRSTKAEDKNQAYKFAKSFYDELNSRRAQGLAVTTKSRFDVCATAMLVAMKAQVARSELTQQTYDITDYRLKKSVLSFFGQRDVADINYDLLEQYLSELSHQTPKLSPSTISSYMKLVRKVLNYAYKRQLVNAIPHFPAIATPDNPRGYFTIREYRRLWSRARALVGKRFELRKLKNKKGEEELADFFEAGKTKEGRKIRGIEITNDLHELIVFMVNSYIRPTDIKNIQHKHIEILRNDHVYLRMSLPKSKKHDHPIVTMPMAVEVYERLTAKNKAKGLGVAADDYLFMPQYTTRDYALQQLQRQFDVLMWSTKLGKGANGEDRTIYSLRHTCIMYRLMYGEAIDVITLAHNARTSPEMINRFYAAQLGGEDNVGMLQSRKRKGKKNQL